MRNHLTTEPLSLRRAIAEHALTDDEVLKLETLRLAIIEAARQFPKKQARA